MNRLLLALLLTATPAIAQDVFVPPVPIGIQGEEEQLRRPKRPIPFPAKDEKWLRVRSPRFDVISSAGEAKTLAILGDLETLASALDDGAPGSQPAIVFVFARRRESQPYLNLLIGRENTNVTGVYVRHDGGGTMFIDASQPHVARTVLHELVHDLLRQSGLTPPLWIEEGLAEYFSNAYMRNGTLFAGDPIREHILYLQKNTPYPLEEMFAVRAESVAATAPLFYAQSWAAVHWLMSLDHTRMEPFYQDLAEGDTPADALRKHYGKSVGDLHDAVRRGGRSARTVKITRSDGLQPVEGKGGLKPAATSVDRATLLYELGLFLSHVNGAGEESLRHYREALSVDPKHARTLAALGEFDAAIAADPKNADVHLTYAEFLLGDAIGPFAAVFEKDLDSGDRFRKARGLAERALALGADAARAEGAIGASWILEIEAKPAIPHLERARQLAPARMDYALHLYSLYLRHDERAKADALFTAAFERARDEQTVFAARNLLLRHETDRATALARAGKLDEAAAVLEQLAAATPDALARRELESEAVRLQATALVNRHIEMYNRAVSLANTGRRTEAIKILDELLSVATDTQVVRDAQQLRQKVALR